MIQMIKHAASQVKAAALNRVKIFINENGNISTINHEGEIFSIGSNLKAGAKLPTLTEVPEGGMVFFNTVTNATVKFTDYQIIIISSNKQDGNQIQYFDFVFLKTYFFYYYCQPFLRDVILDVFMNAVINSVYQAWHDIYFNEAAGQTYFVGADTGDTRNQYDLFIDLLFTYANHFDSTIGGNIISRENCYFFSFDAITTSTAEVNYHEMFEPNGIFYSSRGKRNLAQLILQYAYVMQFLKSSSNFLSQCPTAEALVSNRSDTWMSEFYGSFII